METEQKEADIFAALAAPFPEKDLDWRVIQGGVKGNGEPWAIVAAYVDARAVMDRLDLVVRPENWQDDYLHIGTKGVLAKLGIRIGDDWIWKQDGAEETDIEAFKGGLSKALVRAAVKWQIGRYLYNLPTMYADFIKVEKNTPGARYAKIEKNHFYWLPPKIPAWALPKEAVAKKKEEQKQAAEKAADIAEKKVRLAKDVQADIVSICKVRAIKPKDLNAIVAEIFNVNSQKDLDVNQLEELLNYLDSELK